MADVKISALPAATTPLDGTEVLPIVQSATTKQVSIANVTAGRAMSASSLTLTTPLGVASGGTGLTSLTAGYIPYGNGTGAFGSSPNFVFDGSSLGIGTAPSYPLDINKNVAGIGAARITNTNAGTSVLSALLASNGSANSYFGTTGTGYTTYGVMAANDAFIYSATNVAIGADSATGVIKFGTGNVITERMRVTSAGNVGIGTTSPSGKLDVTGGYSYLYGLRISGNDTTNSIYQSAAIGISSGNYITFSTNAGGPYERMRIDTAGNLGLGVTPSAWNAGAKTLETASGGLYSFSTIDTELFQNCYLGASNWTYKNNGYALRYSQYNGQHIWYQAASGTAENAISFTQAMTLDASGNLGLGTTSINQQGSANNTIIELSSKTIGTAAFMRFRNNDSSGIMDTFFDGGAMAGYVSVATNHPLILRTNNTERARIDSSGNVVINTAAIATNATDGFLYVPTCAGTPTGTPTTYTGRAPIVVNTTNNKLYFYSGGAWRDAGP